MNKFVKINFYNYMYNSNIGKHAFFVDDNNTILISIDAIKSISPVGQTVPLFDNYTAAQQATSTSKNFKEIKLCSITTNIAHNLGINGTGYATYFITNESYNKLIKLIDIAE